MEVGERREWFWSDHTKDNLICVRKATVVDQTVMSYASSSEYSDSDDDIASPAKHVGRLPERMYKHNDTIEEEESPDKLMTEAMTERS